MKEYVSRRPFGNKNVVYYKTRWDNATRDHLDIATGRRDAISVRAAVGSFFIFLRRALLDKSRLQTNSSIFIKQYRLKSTWDYS